MLCCRQTTLGRGGVDKDIFNVKKIGGYNKINKTKSHFRMRTLYIIFK